MADEATIELLGQIAFDTDTISSNLEDAGGDIDALMTLVQNMPSGASPELVAAVEALKTKVAAAAARSSEVASAYTPVPVPPEDPAPGSEPLPTDQPA